jgi:acyl-CoA reductase-like NAD-dependent aldehyde dehydrogenase
LDARLERLAARKSAWVRVGIDERVRYLERCVEQIGRHAEEWARLGCTHRGIDPRSALAGEEWLSGPMVTAQALRQYARTLSRGFDAPARARRRSSGQLVAPVFPDNLLERFLYYDMRGEIWIEPGAEASRGRIYREKAAGRPGTGGVALVLGAGNVSSIPALDLVHKLIVEDQVVLLKTNPVNGYLGPVFERAFAPLLRDGFLEIVGGGAEVGDYLCLHPQVDSIHLTGSDRTHDAIVWGATEEERSRRRAAGEPRVSKPVTAELGCVTPVLVVPGRWSPAQLDFQARHVAAMVSHNSSFNCNAAQVLVLQRGWNLREAFLERVEQALRETPARHAYYPGAVERYRSFRARYPASQVVGPPDDEGVPWTVIRGLHESSDDYVLRNEAFCGLLAELSLAADDAVDFLERAVAFANERLWGTLSCAVIVDDATRRAESAALDRAVERLHYGAVGVNVWPGVIFGMGATGWGAFPGHTPEAIGSGRGCVHNTGLIDHPQKSVLHARFRLWPKPIWFGDHRTLRALGRHLTAFQRRRTPWRLAAVAWWGLLG